MIRLICIILFCLTAANSLFTQPATSYVIAPSGLNLRVGPDTDSRVLKRLPFGTTVTIENDSTYAADTLFTLRDFGYYEYEIGHQQVYGNGDFPITGHWLKVSAEGVSGYLVDTYLFSSPPEDFQPEVVYFDAYSTTWSLDFNPAGYNWYGIFREDDGVKVEQVAAEFIGSASEYSGQIILDVYEGKQRSYGLIGVREELRERTIPIRYGQSMESPFKRSKTFRLAQVGGDTIPLFVPDPMNLKGTYDFRVTDEAVGVDAVFRTTDVITALQFFRLVADLDGDGLDDYIIHGGGPLDMYARILFLSRDMVDGVYCVSGFGWLDYD